MNNEAFDEIMKLINKKYKKQSKDHIIDSFYHNKRLIKYINNGGK